MPHTQISLALREPLALDGSRPQCEPGFRGSQCWENKKKTAACHELGQEFVKQHMHATLNQRE